MAKGPLTPFHLTKKVAVSLNDSEAQFLDQDAGAVTLEPANEMAEVQQGLHGDIGTIITNVYLATLRSSFNALSPTIRDVKPVLSEKTLEGDGYKVEITDMNADSRFSVASDKAALLNFLNKTRGGRTLNSEEIASVGAFLAN